MKTLFLSLVLTSTLCPVGSANERSRACLTNILDGLNKTQQRLQGQLIEATVVERTHVGRLPKHNGQNTTVQSDFGLAQYELQMALFEWGYVAQQGISSNATITAGMRLTNWVLRSNGLSKDIITYANKVTREGLVKVNSEVKMTSGFLPSFVFPPLTPYDMKNLLLTMEGVNATSNSQGLYVFDGILNSAGYPLERFHIVFDSMHNLFPIEGEIYMDGKLLNKWSGVYSDVNQTNYHPEAFSTEVFNNGSVVLLTKYSNIRAIAEHAPQQLMDAGRVSKGSIVNDYRFSRPFAYVQGGRDPTTEELLAMSTNNNAIMKYQKTSALIAPLGYTSPTGKARWVVLAFLAIPTVSGLMFALFRLLRKDKR